jgi:hypothetical protein
MIRQFSLKSLGRTILLLAATSVLLIPRLSAQTAPVAEPSASPSGAPAQLTASEDHQRLMDLLQIKSVRPGADPNHPDAPNAVNYDEARVVKYELPDVLVLKNGRKVTTTADWWNLRRPELIELFDSELYGRVPAQTPKVTWEVLSTIRELSGAVPVITRKLAGHVDNSGYPAITVTIDLTVTTPEKAAAPVPLIIEFGFVFPPGWKPPKGFTMPPQMGPTWKEQLAAKGWGSASLIAASVQADNGAGLVSGVIGLTNHGQPRTPDQWGTLRAWAWGASRALDFFETDKTVDAHQVGIEGLSRYGKAALVTMAYDQRFAIGLIGSSGEGGAKLHRRNFGELVENVAGTGEYHWMAGNFIKYAGPLTANDLPVDAHELIALCAPRPVFISCGSPKVEGNWLDNKGQFLAAVEASPVYVLLGKRGLTAKELPAVQTGLMGSDLAFRQHEGGHTVGPNWPFFIDWASRYLHAPAVPSTSPSAGR